VCESDGRPIRLARGCVEDCPTGEAGDYPDPAVTSGDIRFSYRREHDDPDRG
jgi:hypothetical protein